MKIKELKHLIRECVREIKFEELSSDEKENPLYVEYMKDMPGEEPFMLHGQKFQYVWCKYPNGKEDIGVYAFGQDMCFGYNAFRNMYNLAEESQPEPYDAETDTFAPGPRDRGMDEPLPEKPNSSTKSQDDRDLDTWLMGLDNDRSMRQAGSKFR
jgi:hypothetical protein